MLVVLRFLLVYVTNRFAIRTRFISKSMQFSSEFDVEVYTEFYVELYCSKFYRIFHNVVMVCLPLYSFYETKDWIKSLCIHQILSDLIVVMIPSRFPSVSFEAMSSPSIQIFKVSTRLSTSSRVLFFFFSSLRRQKLIDRMQMFCCLMTTPCQMVSRNCTRDKTRREGEVEQGQPATIKI